MSGDQHPSTRQNAQLTTDPEPTPAAKNPILLFCCFGEIHPKELIRFMTLFDYTISLLSIILACFLLFKETWLTFFGCTVIFGALILAFSTQSATSQVYDGGIPLDELEFYFSFRNYFSLFLWSQVFELSVEYLETFVDLVYENCEFHNKTKIQIFIFFVGQLTYQVYLVNSLYWTRKAERYTTSIVKNENQNIIGGLLSGTLSVNNIQSPSMTNFDAKVSLQAKTTS